MRTQGRTLIDIQNCRIENSRSTIIENISWQMKEGEAWLVTGPNGGGKADFLNALSNNLRIIPNTSTSSQTPLFSSVFADSVEIVSLERAARIIQEERENDESDYVEGGVDIGRTGRTFLAEALFGNVKKNMPLPPAAASFETEKAVVLCGIEKILDRGLKYMSTGEIRRTLLARALLSQKKLLILSDPFAGLDVQSRKILLNFFDDIVKAQTLTDKTKNSPHVILAMERWNEIPDGITHVLEFSQKKISFCGLRDDYENLLKKRKEPSENAKANLSEFSKDIESVYEQTSVLQRGSKNAASSAQNKILVEMKNVNVSWGDNHVLRDLNWTLYEGEHWLIQGPNGSGKTTFLELITGDNMQVFSNDIKIFGNRRGSGETIWDIRQKLGIVSYRLHVEYRMLGGTRLQDVIASGFRDSIGLYGAATDIEKAAADKWLSLGGFLERKNESFGNLSYGEQRAVLILRSAVKCPQILILDEPCHGLDETYREKILCLLEKIGEEGKSTMLHVTHDLSEALSCEKHILSLCPDKKPMYEIRTLA